MTQSPQDGSDSFECKTASLHLVSPSKERLCVVFLSKWLIFYFWTCGCTFPLPISVLQSLSVCLIIHFCTFGFVCLCICLSSCHTVVVVFASLSALISWPSSQQSAAMTEGNGGSSSPDEETYVTLDDQLEFLSSKCVFVWPFFVAISISISFLLLS